MDKGQLGSSLEWEPLLCLPLGPAFITWRTALVNLTVEAHTPWECPLTSLSYVVNQHWRQSPGKGLFLTFNETAKEINWHMLAKWLIKMSNYLHDWGSLPSTERICISSLLGLCLSRAKAGGQWSSTTHQRPHHCLVVPFTKDSPLPRFQSFHGLDQTADHRRTEKYKAVLHYME